ncbi:MAG: DUF998 domain-containing protein [Streptosporangiaceae bacterium]
MGSSVAIPVLLIAGWTIAGMLQPATYSPMRNSLSALAAIGARDRWVMTLVFALTAICYLITALALRPVPVAARLILVAGGLAGLLVAASPEPSGGRFSLAHAVWAAVGFAMLSIWPLAARQAGPRAPWPLRPASALAAVALFAVLLAWFVIELLGKGGEPGLAERAVGVAQAGWLLLVVLSCRLRPPAPLAAAHIPTNQPR